jgi:2-polyprenyl-6-methoxyphenol hydroxylase-like FAD-dependent oxidoreductase
MRSTDVLIVGDGPAGSTLAKLLADYDIPHIIIDRRRHPGQTTRSITVHARTRELMARSGYEHLLHRMGTIAWDMRYHFPGSEPISLRFSLQTRRNGIVMLGQQHLEAALAEAYQWQVERGRELIGLTQVDGRAFATVADTWTGGNKETIEAKWLVGCDGHRSTVRGLAGIPLAVDKPAGGMYQIDGSVYGLPYTDGINYHPSGSGGMVLVAPLKDADRVLVSVPEIPPDLDVSREAFQELLTGIFGPDIVLDTSGRAAGSIFTIQYRIAERFRKGRVLLAGDSAHTLTPFGGQGGNVCMQDAAALAWMLAMVVRGLSHTDLLDTYDVRRRPVADQVMGAQETIRHVLTNPDVPLDRRAAQAREMDFQRPLTALISGLAYNYREAAGAIDPTHEWRLPGRVAGDHAVDARIGPDIWLHDLMRWSRYGHLLLLIESGKGRSAGELEDIAQKVGEQYPLNLMLQIKVIAQGGFFWREHQGRLTPDEHNTIHYLYGHETLDVAVLISPDLYISWRIGLSNPGIDGPEALADAIRKTLCLIGGR